eukprot:TRINITY_DN13368_c0_g1_i1.p1 TRINITY_DN13368_c0_g1~~TRINITY_DN13368_c0_g1_i1.p1  ORF type:complete len:264 (+),score=24.75 TRINITY_DN13368_c0_g1_i1:68-859(+)
MPRAWKCQAAVHDANCACKGGVREKRRTRKCRQRPPPEECVKRREDDERSHESEATATSSGESCDLFERGSCLPHDEHATVASFSACASTRVTRASSPMPGETNCTLVVRVKDASGLWSPLLPFDAQSDCYVMLRVVDAFGHLLLGPKRTGVTSDSIEPFWDEDLVFYPVDMPHACALRVNIVDGDTNLGESYLDWRAIDEDFGYADVFLCTLSKTDSFQDVAVSVLVKKPCNVRAELHIGLNTLGQWGICSSCYVKSRKGGC